MKILFTRFPLESAYGGAEVQTLSLMEGLMKRGHAVAFIGSCPVLLEECSKRGILAAELDIGKPPVMVWDAVSFAWRKNGMKRKLKAALDEFGSLDAICMLSLSEKLLLTDIAAKKGTKVFWIEHDRIGRWLTKNPWLPLLLKQSNNAVTISVSHLSGKIYEELGWDREKIKPIPNGIDETQLRVPRHESRSNAKLHLVCIARLSVEKGIDVLIRSMNDLPDSVTLKIVGEGPEGEKLHDLVNSLHLSQRIRFSPPQKDVSALYSLADALVLPSRDNDPFGLVAAEAMICGLPVVVTDACGIAGYLKDGHDALIVKAGSSTALTQAMKQLLMPSTFETLAKNAPVTAREKFLAERMIDEYEKALKM
jgi:glycosyltransferase involved in cell wall biosynthesis